MALATNIFLWTSLVDVVFFCFVAFQWNLLFVSNTVLIGDLFLLKKNSSLAGVRTNSLRIPSQPLKLSCRNVRQKQTTKPINFHSSETRKNGNISRNALFQRQVNYSHKHTILCKFLWFHTQTHQRIHILMVLRYLEYEYSNGQFRVW